MNENPRVNVSVSLSNGSKLKQSITAAPEEELEDLNELLDALELESLEEEEKEEEEEDDQKKKFRYRRRIKPSALPILRRHLIKDKFLRNLQRRFPDVQFHGLDTDGKTFWEYNITLPGISTTEERTKFIIDAKPQELFMAMRNWLRRVRALPTFEPNTPWLQRIKVPGVGGPPVVWIGYAGSFMYEFIFARQGPGLICRLLVTRID